MTAPVPKPPRREYSFTGFQVANPTAPPPSHHLDGEYDRINRAIGDIIAWVSESLDPDGSLKALPAVKPQASSAPRSTDHGDSFALPGADPTATALDWAEVSFEWAEHMPDTIPPNILATMGITGDHWSSRWWAHRALEIVGGDTGGLEGFARVFIGVDPPAASVGALWWCATDGQLYLRYDDGSSAQWVPATNQLQGQATAVLPPPPPAVIVTPSLGRTGETIALTQVKPHYVNNPDVLADLALRLPVAALGEIVDISFRRPVTALALLTNTGAAIPDAPTSAYGPGAGIQMRFDVPGWLYWK